MYEPVIQVWSRYANLLGATLPREDTRPLVVSAEIHTRFGQLDMILGRLTDTLDTAADSITFRSTWDWTAMYTDSFYFFGWRVVDLLNGAEGGRFPHLEPIEATGLLSVRGHLLDHPERQGQYYRHALEFRDEIQDKVGRAIAILETGP
jgi:hypothetical protein